MNVLINDKRIIVSEQAITLAKQFAMYDPISVANINCGLHSGIRPCCVMHHMIVSTAVDLFRGRWDSPFGILLRKIHNNQKSETGEKQHGLCPACILRDIIAEKLKVCECWSGHKDYSYLSIRWAK